MKRLLSVLCVATLLCGCASMAALSGGTPANAANASREAASRNRAGSVVTTQGADYPQVIVTSEGGHAVVMPPCGNLSVVVNPDGSHSIAIINGQTATIATP